MSKYWKCVKCIKSLQIEIIQSGRLVYAQPICFSVSYSALYLFLPRPELSVKTRNAII